MALLALPGVLIACSSGGPTDSHVSSAVIGHFKGVPNGVTFPTSQRAGQSEKPSAAWAGPRSIYVLTWGSGSCPKIPSSVDASRTHRVVINTVEHDFYKGDNACTTDLAVTTSVVRVPWRIETTRALAVQIDGTTTRLASRAS